jgi:acetolactate decarboxylase
MDFRNKPTERTVFDMNKIKAILLAAAMMIPLTACSAQQPETKKEAENNRETVYQVALLQSLTQGYYDGIIKVSELKQHGDTGIGTFEGVNGEMIVLDGKVYQALGDGSVQEADDNETVPFSNVTFFDKDLSATLAQTADINSLKDTLTKTVSDNGRNLFYMVKINGTFPKMNVRSELKQEKPYKSLDKALATDQREFNYENIKGTVVALYCPDYMGGLNTPGWHFHFISDDKTKGGHILELAFDTAEAEFDATRDFDMYLSDNKEFQGMELSKDVSDAIKKVETNEK